LFTLLAALIEPGSEDMPWPTAASVLVAHRDKLF
jgi:hypothetical protein